MIGAITQGEIHTMSDIQTPFVNRQQLINQFQNHLTSSGERAAITFIGRRKIGKTALLHQLRQRFTEGTICLYVALSASVDEDTLLKSIAQQTIDAVTGLDYVMRVPVNLPEDDDEIALRDWLADECLPHLTDIMRSRQRLALLLDDAHHLIDMVQPSDDESLAAYFYERISPQMSIGLSLPLRYEDRLDVLAPLVRAPQTYRLNALTQEEAAPLFLEYAELAIPNEILTQLYENTGGEPLLLAAYHTQTLERELRVITQQNLDAITPAIYAAYQTFFRTRWDELDGEQRLILTAIVGMIYDDPLQPIQPSRISNWLAAQDYTVDTTTINAAMRGLEYLEIIDGQGRIRSKLLRRWLIENARLEAETSGAFGGFSREVLLAGVALLVAVTLLIAVAASLTEGDATSASAPPTVTLVP
jgi:hypothetical protein